MIYRYGHLEVVKEKYENLKFQALKKLTQY